jgi:hypothetical protein
MRKDSFLSHFANLPADQPLRPDPVPYKFSGSTYSQDGVRITGSPAFVDAVLSRLKDLAEFEYRPDTRLAVNYGPVKARDKRDDFVRDGSVSCYLQVHRRGPQAAMCNALIAGMRKRAARQVAGV